MYGNNLKEFLNKIIVNKEINNKVFLLSWDFSKILNSLFNIEKIFIQSIFIREGINHIEKGISENPKIVLIQLRENIGSVDGSNDENRFVIIFKLIC